MPTASNSSNEIGIEGLALSHSEIPVQVLVISEVNEAAASPRESTPINAPVTWKRANPQITARIHGKIRGESRAS